MRKKCKIMGCEKLAHGAGFCSVHYRKMKRSGVKLETSRTYIQGNLRHGAFEKRDFLTCYFAGVLYGDGCIMGNRVRLAMADLDVIQQYIRFVGFPQDRVRFDERGARVQGMVDFSSRQMVEDLKFFQVVPGKTKRLFTYPDGINDRGYLLGLYDADGTVSTTRLRGFRIVGNESFANALEKKLCDLGFKANARIIYSGGVDVYAMNLSGKSHVEFLQWMYQVDDTPVYCTRKAHRVMLSLWGGRKKFLLEKWVNSWEAKFREEYVNHEPSFILNEEGAETNCRAVGNSLFEAPTIRQDDDIVRYPAKAGLSVMAG